MNEDIDRSAEEIESRLELYRIEQLEPRYEFASIGNSQCSSTCGTESAS